MSNLNSGVQLLSNEASNRSGLVLRAVGITKSYETPTGRLPVLEGVDLQVARGTILAILGASGSGKTTLLNILGTLDRAEAGSLEVASKQVDRLRKDDLARLRSRDIGFVYQFHHLLPEFDALENVMMPLKIAGEGNDAARRRAGEALERVGLNERWDHLPSQLSGGEAQRVAVARALAASPAIVLADEPSGNLDPVSAAALHLQLRTLARDHGQAFVVATHSERLAAEADQVLVLERGRVRPA